jgi:NhaP-type Na+/H+ or K+/H+ antiporter
VIILFSTFVTMAQGGSAKAVDFLNIPISIILGVLLGTVAGICLYLLFEKAYQHDSRIRNSTKVVIILGTAFLLMSVETLVKPYVAISGLLAVVAMACVIKLKSDKSVSSRLSEKYGKLWIGAEVVLFVLVGAAVDVRYTLAAGASALLMIFIALAFRAVGVIICLLGTKLTIKERLFCIIAYLPKATVQAAIGSVPLSLGLSCGKTVLSVAVLAILITAPLGAIGIDRTCYRILEKEES